MPKGGVTSQLHAVTKREKEEGKKNGRRERERERERAEHYIPSIRQSLFVAETLWYVLAVCVYVMLRIRIRMVCL